MTDQAKASVAKFAWTEAPFEAASEMVSTAELQCNSMKVSHDNFAAFCLFNLPSEHRNSNKKEIRVCGQGVNRAWLSNAPSAKKSKRCHDRATTRISETTIHTRHVSRT
ncbi:hypothetical protein GN244_ATG02572 [Phytophthora infestans]|uniref:Uncharacterized protein n=1 Tax=Phytophthora infestans TaxID=4787 RepID=A0A833T8A6_PHYIN|nr:hypothetical protein GN244_ATG02572 [Phytophthora infestans]